MKSRYMFFAVVALVAVVAATVTPVVMAAYIDPSIVANTLILGVGAAVTVDFNQSKKLREQRAELVKSNEDLLKRITAEQDSTRRAELEKEWDKRDDDIVKLTDQIKRAERQEVLNAEMEQPANQRRSGRENTDAPSAEQRAEQHKAYRAALFDYIRNGTGDMSAENRVILRSGYRSVEQRDGMSTTNAAGGYTIPTDLFRELQNSLLAFGGARARARILTTDSGNPINIPTVDDTTNKAQIVSEGSSLTSPQDTSFGVVALTAYMYRTLLPITFELLQDSAFDLEAWIMDAFKTRLGRGTNVHFTTGNGTTQPKGYIPGTNSGVTFASATSISFNDLVDLEHSVDPAYRVGPSVAWKFKDSTLKVIKKLVDSQNRPLWLSGIAVKEPDTILGYPYDINQDMAAIQASNKSVAFGDWSKFIIRDVRNPLIIRANEKFIDQGSVGFYLFSRHDSDVLDAGTDPIKHGTHPSPD